MANLMVILVLLLVVGSAAAYVYKARQCAGQGGCRCSASTMTE